MFDEINYSVKTERRVNLENRSTKWCHQKSTEEKEMEIQKEKKGTANIWVPERIVTHTHEGVTTALHRRWRWCLEIAPTQAYNWREGQRASWQLASHWEQWRSEENTPQKHFGNWKAKVGWNQPGFLHSLEIVFKQVRENTQILQDTNHLYWRKCLRIVLGLKGIHGS